MTLKQISYHFKKLFQRPKAELHIRVYDKGTHMDYRGEAGYLGTGLAHLFEDERIKPLIMKVQEFLIEKHTGINPRKIAERALLDHLAEHGMIQQEPPKKKKELVN